jgi:tripartite ATP-independent transporter DctM subunit
MSPEVITALMLGAAVALIVLGYPIAFVLGGLATVLGLAFVGPGIMNLFMLRLYGLLQDYVLLAIPLFVFMGLILEQTGIAARMYEALRLMMGRLPGGIALATIATGTVFAAGTGVVGAAVVTLGLVALPSMLRYRYDRGLASGAVCAAGTLGIIIPPSIMIVIYGPMAGLSVGSLFMAAILPGLLLSTLYVVYTVILCYFRPQSGPPLSKEETAVPLSRKLYLFFTSVVRPKMPGGLGA